MCIFVPKLKDDERKKTIPANVVGHFADIVWTPCEIERG